MKDEWNQKAMLTFWVSPVKTDILPNRVSDKAVRLTLALNISFNYCY